MHHPHPRTILLSLLLVLAPVLASAQATVWNFNCDSGRRTSWQAVVTDSAGSPLAPGTYSLEYCYYLDSTKAQLIGCCATTAVVTLAVESGARAAATASYAKAYLAYPDPYEDTAKKAGGASLAGSPYWLEITFNGELFDPVTRVGSSPYAGVSGRVSGDIYTRPGDLFVPGRDGSGGGVGASADSGGTRLILERSPYAGSVASDTSWVEFTLDSDGPGLSMGNVADLQSDTTYVTLHAGAGGGRMVVQDSVGSGRTTLLGSGVYVYNAFNGATSYFNRTGIKLPQGAAAGYVLTSSATGIGTWQAPTGGTPVGVAQAVEGSQGTSIDTVLTVLLAQTISCPTAGYVVATGSCQGRVTYTFPFMTSVDFGLSLSSAGLPSDQDRNWRLPDSLPSGVYDAPISTQRVFPVAAGDTTIYFLARDTQFGSGSPSAWDKTLTLLFVANSYGPVVSSAVASDGRADEMESGVSVAPVLPPSPSSSGSTRSLEERVRQLEAQVRRLSEAQKQ